MSTDPTPTGAGPRWLGDDEMAAWLELVRVVTLLPQALDRQLRDDAGIGHVYYQILAMLSAAPEGTLRMSELARLTGISASRLSHAVSSLESRGWVARAACAEDGRGQVARLTDDGFAVLSAAAPGHVETVRAHVIDALTPEQITALTGIAEAIIAAGAGDR
jgi:DNA-binding MarR family transcriptional regulator